LKRYSHPHFDDWGPHPSGILGDRLPLGKVQVCLEETTAGGTRPFRLRMSPSMKYMGKWFDLALSGEFDLTRGLAVEPRLETPAAPFPWDTNEVEMVGVACGAFGGRTEILPIDDIRDVQRVGSRSLIVLGRDSFLELNAEEARGRPGAPPFAVVRRAIRFASKPIDFEAVARVEVEGWPAWAVRHADGTHGIVLDGAMIPTTLGQPLPLVDSNEGAQLRQALRSLQRANPVRS
jgi:hypothetical protein